MIMRRWRVGSLSMGIILMASGIVLMVSMITKINVTNIFLTFWPAILVCLGLEILLHLFIKTDDGTDFKIKYDVLSVVFIGLILFVSVLFYIATFSIGLLSQNGDMYTALGIRPQDAYFESSIELAGTNELVVFDGNMSIKAVQTQDDNIRVEYRLATRTNDIEYAVSTLDKALQFEQGERAYMMTNSSLLYNSGKIGYTTIDCIVYLPQGKVLDVSQYNSGFEYDTILESQIIHP